MRRRGAALLGWSGAAVALVLGLTWVAVGTHPALAGAGLTWADAAFTEQPAHGRTGDGVVDREGETWVAWDVAEGAWVSVLLRNPRPYPVTVAVVEQGPGAQAHLARPAGAPEVLDLRPTSLDLAQRLVVEPGGPLVVLVRFDDSCLTMSGGSAIGTGSVELEVSSLGLTATLRVPLPTTYLVGRTADHEPPAGCAAADAG